MLAVLLRTGTPLTGRRVHSLVAGRHSLGAVQQALRDLESLGVITTTVVGRAGIHSVNEDHVAISSLRELSSPLDMLARVVADEARDVDAVIVFGSIARGEADRDSDIDLAVIAPEAWGGRALLQQRVSERLGNQCDVLHLTGKDFELALEPVVAEIRRDGIALTGSVPRVSRATS